MTIETELKLDRAAEVALMNVIDDDVAALEQGIEYDEAQDRQAQVHSRQDLALIAVLTRQNRSINLQAYRSIGLIAWVSIAQLAATITLIVIVAGKYT